MKYLRLLLGFALSAVALFFAFRDVDFGDVGRALRSAAYWWIVPAAALITCSLVLRGIRWRLLFYPQRGLGFRNVFGAMNAGYLVNTVLPLRLGEVVRAVLLGQLEDVRTAHALSTVVVERVLDLLTTIVVLGLLIPFVPLPEGSTLPLVAGTALAVGALGVMLAAGTHPALAHRPLQLVTAHLPERWSARIHHLLDSFLDGFKELRNARVAAQLVGLSVIIWLTIAAGIACMLLAFHLHLPPTAPLFVLALISLSFIVPSSPGHVGVFQFVAVEALAIGFAVERTEALSFALVTNLVSFAPPALLGAWFVWRSGLSLGRLVSFGKRSPAESESISEEPRGPSPALPRR